MPKGFQNTGHGVDRPMPEKAMKPTRESSFGETMTQAKRNMSMRTPDSPGSEAPMKPTRENGMKGMTDGMGSTRSSRTRPSMPKPEQARRGGDI